MNALFVRARRMVLPDGERAASFLAEDGVIAAVGAYDAPVPSGAEVLDPGDFVVLPGLVDPHVHVNEPGRTDWEGFTTATRAAAAGGITTIVDMPLNSIPPTLTADALAIKRGAAESQAWVDVAFWGGATPEHLDDLPGLDDAGACGAKAFLAPSGVPEFAHCDAAAFARAVDVAGRYGGTLLVHAEWPAELRELPPGSSYAAYAASRPPAAELEAIAFVVRTLREHAKRGGRARVHVVHLSAGDGVRLVEDARREGLALTAETCPHYLVLAAEDVPDGATLCKCAPPIRGRANRDLLWDGLVRGAISLVASDHSPSPAAGKALESGDFAAAWGGVNSLGLSLPLVWTEAAPRGVGLADVVRWMCAAPAALARLDATKGAIRVGADADFVVFDPGASWTIEPERLHVRHRITPYAGRTVRGRVIETRLAGKTVWKDGAFVGSPAGRLVRPLPRVTAGHGGAR